MSRLSKWVLSEWTGLEKMEARENRSPVKELHRNGVGVLLGFVPVKLGVGMILRDRTVAIL